MSDPVETRGPEPADRSPEPADREAAWEKFAGECDAKSARPDLNETARLFQRPVFDAGWLAAMAAADERERALTERAKTAEAHVAEMGTEAEKDDAERGALTEALREVRDVASKGHAATEHLRDCDLAGTHDADAAIVLDFLNAHDALFRKPRPVPVEAEPEEEN